MQIYLSQNGAHTGPFALDEVRKMVVDRQRSLTDIGWHPGLANWVPLSAILSMDTVSVPPPVPTHPAGIRAGLGHKAEVVLETVTGEINVLSGGSRVEGLHGKQFLSNVLKKRKDDEMEDLFITGTRAATPPLEDIDTQWPRPWVFFKTILISLFIFAGFYIGSVWMDNDNMVPGAILVGSFAVPASTLIFFIEMNVARNFSVYQILRLVFMGGMVALLIALFLDLFIPAQTDNVGDLTWLGAAATGLVEESAKVLTAVFFMGRRRFNWSLNGLLIGAAVGTGFSAFESAGYAFTSLLKGYRHMVAHGDSSGWPQAIAGMIHSIEIRGVLAPYTHIVWAALAVAALWKVKGEQPFKLRMLFHPRFLWVFAIVVLFHTLWDGPVPFVTGIPGEIIWGFFLGGIAWIMVFGYIQDGLKQIRRAQSAAVSLPPEA